LNLAIPDYAKIIPMDQIIKPTAHLLCGFIGSGKTTFARKLEKETAAIRFTKDEWMVKVFGNNPPKDKFAEYDSGMTELATEMALRCLKSGANVIIDDGFWYRKQRNEIRQALKDMGVVTKFYYIDTPVDIMKTRTVKRSENPPLDSFYISEQEFDGYLKMFEPPTDDEEFISIKS
jgi:predicted kinase